MKIRTGIFLGCLVALVALVAFVNWVMFGDHVYTGFHQASVEWLPASASDIPYYRNRNVGNVFAYEFHISMADFETPARERGWKLKPADFNFSVERFTSLLPSGHAEHKEPFRISASGGKIFEDRHPNGGGISVLFDSSNSTAYVFSSSR